MSIFLGDFPLCEITRRDSQTVSHSFPFIGCARPPTNTYAVRGAAPLSRWSAWRLTSIRFLANSASRLEEFWLLNLLVGVQSFPKYPEISFEIFPGRMERFGKVWFWPQTSFVLEVITKKESCTHKKAIARSLNAGWCWDLCHLHEP